MRILLLALLTACPPKQTDTHADPDTETAAPCAALPRGASSERIGNPDDTVVVGTRRAVLMGGSAEVDPAMALHVAGAGGGDVVVLRASGSTSSYLEYLASEVGADPAPASVEVIRIDNPPAGADDSVLCRVDRAEAVWLAGGDQSDYLLAWPSELHASLGALADRGATVGGTSAGAMALSQASFDADGGSITSGTALADPSGDAVSVSLSPFAAPELDGVIVDTHFMAREREGRLLAFAVAAQAAGLPLPITAVGIDERSALVVEDGSFAVHSSSGGSVWLYRVAEVAAQSGPLDLERVGRIRLVDGDAGVWPVDWTAFDADALTVVDGVVAVHGD